MDPNAYGHFPHGAPPAHPLPSTLGFTDELDPVFYGLEWTASQPKMTDPNSLDYGQYAHWPSDAVPSSSTMALGLPPLYDPSGQLSSYPGMISLNEDQLAASDFTSAARSAFFGSNSSYSDEISAYASSSQSPSNVSSSPFPTSPLSLPGGRLTASPTMRPESRMGSQDDSISLFSSYDMFLSGGTPLPTSTSSISLSTIDCSPTLSQKSLHKLSTHKSGRPRSSTGTSSGSKRKTIHAEATCAESRSNSCSKCPQRFARARDLKRHFRLHTGEKPYRCVACGLDFIRSDARGRHLASSPICARLHEQQSC